MGAGVQPIRFAVYKYGRDAGTFKQIEETIRQNLPSFRKPGVVSVRPGYKAVGGWLTRKPSIIVTVEAKRGDLPADQLLPAKVGAFPVDVRQATTLEKIRKSNPQQFAAIAATQRPEFTLPEFTTERDIDLGQQVATMDDPALAAARAAKPEIEYTPPAGATLDAMEDSMSIICHASPDAGWSQLKQFFSQIQSTLTVGMYDFTSKHILDALDEQLRQQGAQLTLTLDHPKKNPTADQTDDETVQQLSSDLQDGLKSAWALVRSSRKAPEWIYPTAYHIKVAVRDSQAMWLSSGNWNNSNQPDIDPLQDPAGSEETAKNSDRDWHVIVNHAGLSSTYEAFLKNDYQVANQVETAPALAAAGVTAADPMAEAAMAAQVAAMAAELSIPARAPAQYFPPLTIPAAGTTTIRIQPILTPDNYYDHVLALIQSAQKTFYMQTQYIHPSDKADDQPLADLITAVVALQQKGADVRIILSQWETQGSGGWLDKLQATGLDLNSVRLQNGVHNKGIVVDSSVVMLGSQNWSADGVIRNRDASLILYNEQAAKYYEGIFLHDWTNMAQQTGV